MTRILIAEDNPTLQRSLVRLMQSRGYSTMAAFNGLEALAMIEGGYEPDVIVSDGDMPLLSGRELHDRLPDALRAKFVAYTGSAEMFDGLSCPVIVKPNTDGLLQAVGELVKARAA